MADSVLRPYDPTLRDKVNAFLEGDDPTPLRRHIIEGIMGRSSDNSGQHQPGLIDYTPAGLPFNAYEAGRSGALGNYGAAAMSGLNAVPNALMGKVVGKIGDLLPSFAPSLTEASPAATMTAETNPVVQRMAARSNVIDAVESPTRRGFIQGLGAVGAATAIPGVAGKAIEAVAPKAVGAATPAITPEIATHIKAYNAHMEAMHAHEKVMQALNEENHPDFIGREEEDDPNGSTQLSDAAFVKSQEAAEEDYKNMDSMYDSGHDEIADGHAGMALTHEADLEKLTGLKGPELKAFIEKHSTAP